MTGPSTSSGTGHSTGSGTGYLTNSGTGTMTYKSTLLSTKYNGCIHVHIEMWEWKLLYWKHKKS